jgi:hypothetical protein
LLCCAVECRRGGFLLCSQRTYGLRLLSPMLHSTSTRHTCADVAPPSSATTRQHQLYNRHQLHTPDQHHSPLPYFRTARDLLAGTALQQPQTHVRVPLRVSQYKLQKYERQEAKMEENKVLKQLDADFSEV